MGVDQGTWLISFADLITLLLCAFLMFFSLTWNRAAPHGIQIATEAVESQKVSPLERRIELRFLEKEVDAATGRLTDEGLKKVKKLVASGSYKDATVTLEACSDSRQPPSLHLLRGQLVDTGIEEKLIAERFVGGSCDLLKKEAHSSEELKAVIRFEQNG